MVWRGGRDSNPRGDCSPSGLANRRTRPLCDLPVRYLPISIVLAEGVGFEPTRLSSGDFQDHCLKPLGHPSVCALGAVSRSCWQGFAPGTLCWQAGQDLNLQPAVLETAALPIVLPAFPLRVIIPHCRLLCNWFFYRKLFPPGGKCLGAQASRLLRGGPDAHVPRKCPHTCEHLLFIRTYFQMACPYSCLACYLCYHGRRMQ